MRAGEGGARSDSVAGVGSPSSRGSCPGVPPFHGRTPQGRALNVTKILLVTSVVVSAWIGEIGDPCRLQRIEAEPGHQAIDEAATVKVHSTALHYPHHGLARVVVRAHGGEGERAPWPENPYCLSHDVPCVVQERKYPEADNVVELGVVEGQGLPKVADVHILRDALLPALLQHAPGSIDPDDPEPCSREGLGAQARPRPEVQQTLVGTGGSPRTGRSVNRPRCSRSGLSRRIRSRYGPRP